jgi:hypothetical protein
MGLKKPLYHPKATVTCVPGYDVLGVYTINDPAVTTVTVVIDSVNYTPTFTQFGLLWHATVSTSDLTAFTRYSWSVSQGSNSDSGSLLTSPGVTDEYYLIVASCDNNTNLAKGHQFPFAVEGNWPHIKKFYDSHKEKMAGILFIDDYGYVDGSECNDDFDATCSGVVTTGAMSASSSDNDASWHWAKQLGMLGQEDVIHNEVTSATHASCVWAREEGRSFCRKNLNLFPQWGDHEFEQGDLGYSTSAIAGSNSRWTTYPTSPTAGDGVEGAGAKAWKATLGLLQPPHTGTADTNSNHWSVDLGSLHISTMDGISNGNGTAADNLVMDTTVFGTAQITDLDTALTNTPAMFKILGTQNGYRSLSTTAKSAALAQNPMESGCLTEITPLDLDTIVMFTGDLHRSTVLRHIDQEFDQWHCGTMNHRTPHLNMTIGGSGSGGELVTGDTFTDGTKVTKVLDDSISLTHDNQTETINSHVIIHVKPSLNKMIVTNYNNKGNPTYVQEYTSNRNINTGRTESNSIFSIGI